MASCFTPREYRKTPAVAIVAKIRARTTTTPRDFIFDPPCPLSSSTYVVRRLSLVRRFLLHESDGVRPEVEPLTGQPAAGGESAVVHGDRDVGTVLGDVRDEELDPAH